MKKRNILILLAVIVLGAFALGTVGGVALAPAAEAADLPQEPGQEPGALIGVLVTLEPLDLFDFEGYFNDHPDTLISGGEIGSADAEAYSGRIYAEIEDKGGRGTYAFPGIEGFACMAPRMSDERGEYTAFSGDPALSETQTAINVTDCGNGLTLAMTMYVCNDSEIRGNYCNPIYQEKSGAVYVTAGQGTTIGGELTGSYTTTLTDTKTSTVNGETTELTSSITVTVSCVARPEAISVTQFGEGGKIVKREAFAPGEVPETMQTEKDAAYLVVETRSADGALTRELYEPGDTSFTTLCAREDGICIQSWTALDWGREEN